VSWGLANAAMLLGLLGMAIPVIIHLLNRRRAVTVDWGAMQFLELGRRARRRLNLTELLLMAGRMLLLGLVALALARPFWKPTRPPPAPPAAAAERRDVVLILDGSDSMGRQAGGTSPRTLAVAWARRFVGQLKDGDSVAVLVAKDRVLPRVAPPSYDRKKVDAALADLPAARGSSDLPAALAEAFRLLESTRNPAREVVVLTDGQRVAWRPGEPGRWALLRDLHRRLPVPPRLWSVAFNRGAKVEGADGSVGPLELSRGLVAPHLPIAVRTVVANAGPGPLTRTAELLVDGAAVPGSAQVVGPIPPGSKAPLAFRTTLAAPGSHALAVRLAAGDDPLPGDDEAARPGRGDRGVARPAGRRRDGPGAPEQRDRLPPHRPGPHRRRHAAGARHGRRARRAEPEALKGQRVLVLANVDRLDPGQVAAVTDFLGRGGGVLFAPGDRTDADSANDALFQDGHGWLPARLGATKGDPARREAVAHPSPAQLRRPEPLPVRPGGRPGPGPGRPVRLPGPGALAARAEGRGDGAARHGRPLDRRAALPRGACPPAGRPDRRRGGDPAGQPRLRPLGPRADLPPGRPDRRRRPGPPRRGPRVPPRPAPAGPRRDLAAAHARRGDGPGVRPARGG
jgi:hypothetical protein